VVGLLNFRLFLPLWYFADVFGQQFIIGALAKTTHWNWKMRFCQFRRQWILVVMGYFWRKDGSLAKFS